MSIEDLTTDQLIKAMGAMLKMLPSDEIGNHLAAFGPVAQSGIDAGHLKWVIDQDKNAFVDEMMGHLRAQADQYPDQVRQGILTAWGLT